MTDVSRGPGRAEIRRALAATTGDMLIPAGFGLTVLYAIYAVGWLFRPVPYAHLDAVIEGVSGALFLSASLLLRRRPVPTAWAHPLALGYGLLLLANCLLTLAQERTPNDTFDIVMLLVGGAVFYRSVPYLLALIGFGATGWVLVARYAEIGSATLPYMYLVVEASVIAVLVNVALVRTAVRLERARYELRQAADCDPLTGLYNRRGFWEYGTALIRAADGAGVRFEAMFVDIDRMKDINDQHGHSAGDEAISDTARFLRHSAPAGSVIGRLGGDEFCLLLPLSMDGAETRERIGALMAHANRFRRPPLSLSIGAAGYDPAAPCSLDDLLARGDEEMYRNKANSRRRVRPSA